ncbi:MAG TPA: PEP/pyruvate-binding domain-containing protein [Streptosporangiaceae bacterium]|nr:PEP/pyruvate-binding domain-containing protein [Streptosporangiaceae bacterium]
MSDHLIRDFAGIGGADRPAAGGKGASLGELTRAGILVPPGFVVTTTAFERTLASIDPDGAARERVEILPPDDHAGVSHVAGELRARIASAPMPADVRAAIIEAYRALGDGALVAVRSSATGEDGEDASYAGLQDTYLCVRGATEVLDRVRACWASLYNDHSVGYRLRRGRGDGTPAMGVVIQRMVDPRSAGVMFTRSPTTGDRSVVAVEACWGLGSALVSGDVTPDAYVVSKVTGEIIKRTVSAKLHLHRRGPGGTGVVTADVPDELRARPCLDDDEIRALVRLARRVEDHYGAPQDIEWAIARDLPPGEDIVVLQSRPETVWGGRAAAPVAAPKARAFDHVLDSLSHRGAAE